MNINKLFSGLGSVCVVKGLQNATGVLLPSKFLIFPSGSRVRTIPIFPTLATFQALFYNVKQRKL